jgi:SAM-dependent methyltransferase
MADSKTEKLRSILRPGAPPPSLAATARSTAPGLLGRVQHLLKFYPRFYSTLVSVFSPVRPSPQYCRELQRLLATHGHDAVVLNVGSGTGHLSNRADFINIDLFALPGVDIQADALDIPVLDDCADLVFNIAMLEHVPEPELVVMEMLRVLKPGGLAFAFLPFMQPFHGAPEDYQRWTMNGILNLFGEFSSVNVGLGAGPASAWTWITLEWFSLLMSFGNRTLKDIIFLAAMPFFAPFKHLDIFLCSHPSAEILASGFYVVAKK